MTSPVRIVPASRIRALRPRIRWARPVGEFTQRSASLPNRALNFAQPVWGVSLISMTAVPIARRLPMGRFASLLEVEAKKGRLKNSEKLDAMLQDELRRVTLFAEQYRKEGRKS